MYARAAVALVAFTQKEVMARLRECTHRHVDATDVAQNTTYPRL